MATHAIGAVDDFDAVWVFEFVALSFGGRSAVETFSGTVLPRFHLFWHGVDSAVVRSSLAAEFTAASLPSGPGAVIGCCGQP